MLYKKAKRVRVASAKDGGDGSSESSGKDKAQTRRAQVRRAQIQHRQRKANYVKQLEVDIAGIRESIARAERDREMILSENAAIRAHLENVLTQAEGQMPGGDLPPTYIPTSIPEFYDIDLNDLTLDFGIDDIMDSPVFRLSGQSSNAGEGPSASQTDSGADQNPLYAGDLSFMTAEQNQQAINFILAWVHPSSEEASLAEYSQYGI